MTDRRPLVTRHTLASPDPLVVRMPSIAEREGWYVRSYGMCPRIFRVHLDGFYATEAEAKAFAADNPVPLAPTRLVEMEGNEP